MNLQDGGVGGTGGGTGGAGGTGGMVIGCMDTGGPLVTVTQPTPETDPNGAGVIIANSLIAQCTVMQSGATAVDTDSVVITVVGEDAASADLNNPDPLTLTPTTTQNGSVADTYDATADLTPLANGRITVLCEGSDLGDPAACNSKAISTFIDLGPRINIIQPLPDASVSGSMTVIYELIEDDLGAGDTMSTIVSDSLVVAGQTIGGGTTSGNQRSVPVDFNDPIFGAGLDGTFQFTVSATNARGATRTVTQDFTVDSSGPTINFIEPAEGELIGGATLVVVEITDPSGVDTNQITMTIDIDGATFPMTQVPGQANQYSASFDANQYGRTITEVTIDVRAVDLAGNATVASQPTKLDATPPVADLDPEDIVETQIATDMVTMMEELQCSLPFDPVGSDSVDDGEVVGTVPEFRARIEDRANGVVAPMGVVVSRAPIDNSTVKLHLLSVSDGTDRPLVVDTDGDAGNLCDAINPDFLQGNPMGNVPTFVVDLIPIAPNGTSFFDEDAMFPPPFDAFCSAGNGSVAPEPLCITTPLARVMEGPSRDEPAIYAKPPRDTDRCVGDSFDWQPHLPVGWACAAVEMADELGNSNVSRPIRVCFDNVPGSPGTCPGNYGDIFDPGFSCSDGCTPETSFGRFISIDDN